MAINRHKHTLTLNELTKAFLRSPSLHLSQFAERGRSWGADRWMLSSVASAAVLNGPSFREAQREREKRTQRGQRADHLLFCTDHYTHLSYLQSEHCSQSSFKNTECAVKQESVAIMRQMISSAFSVHLVLPSHLLSHLSLLTHRKHTKMKRFSWRIAQENR